MELTFEQIDGYWISEFEVSADFNLHLEREDVGTLHFYQRTTPHGEYDYIKNQGYNADDKVIDLDFQSLVYPKWIKIKSAVKPLVATITTDGEVNEVVYQAKDIEITSNGTTKVTADTGYTALGSVNVKVNVPTEGGGLSYKYVMFEKKEIFEVIYACASVVKGRPSDGEIGFEPAFVANRKFDEVYAFAIDFNGTKFTTLSETPKSLSEVWPSEELENLLYITEEEFYHIPQDEGWPLNTQEDYKAAWDKLYPLIERYGADYINENKLSLAPWYKSLTIGDNVVTELLSYRISYAEEDYKRERILFTTYTGIEKITYTDGTIEYQSYNPPM